MARARDILRSGTWLTRERVRLIAAAILLGTVIVVLNFGVKAERTSLEEIAEPLSAAPAER